MSRHQTAATGSLARRGLGFGLDLAKGFLHGPGSCLSIFACILEELFFDAACFAFALDLPREVEAFFVVDSFGFSRFLTKTFLALIAILFGPHCFQGMLDWFWCLSEG